MIRLFGKTGQATGECLLIAGLGIAWLAWITSPFLLMGRLGYVRSNELGDAVYPQVAYIVRMLREGHFSLWLPAQAGGTDLLGNFNSPYLNVLLFVLLPAWLANNLIFTIVAGIAGFSTYRLLRLSFNCSKLLACAGGLLYSSWFLISFGGLVFAYAAGLSFALAPVVLDRLLRTRSLTLNGVVQSTLLGLVFSFGGHYTWSIFILGSVFICAMALAPQRGMLWFPHLGIVGLVTVMCQLPILLANIQTAALSARTVEAYYRTNRILPLIENYFDQNPSFSPYGQLVLACTLLAGLSVVLSNSRGNALRCAWPAFAFALVFVLLPVLDVVVLYTLSVLNIGGFSLDANGDFGGPFDCRLRISRAFMASASVALSADVFWREVLSPATGSLGSAGVGALRLGRVSREGGRARLASFASDSRHWLSVAGATSMLKGVGLRHLRRIGEVVLVVAALGGALDTAFQMVNLVGATVHSMRRMAADGMNFSAYYRHPQLQELAAQNPDVETFRVATVQLNAPDTVGGGPCCEPREASLYAGFQAAYTFELADAYMSNLTRRSVNFWDLAITGHPGFPRADFDVAYRRKFLYPQHAFTQKLYLFQPIGTGQVGADGCIRQTMPVDFSANYNLDLLSLDNVKFIVSGFPLHDRRLTLLESGLRHELSALQCASEADRLEAFRTRGLMGRPLFIYRNSEVAPRVFAPPALEVLDDERSVYEALTSRSVAQMQRVALAAKKDLPANNAYARDGLQVSLEKVSVLRGDHLQIETSSEGGGVLIVSSSYSPFWKAEAEGQPLAIFPAYHTFIGILIPSGRHAIDLRYRPPYARLLGGL